MNLSALAQPFTASEIEWRVGQAGQNKKGIWCKVLAYITNRAIMERLDEVCGPENWRNEFRYEQGKAILCGISIRVILSENTASREWVTKWDGAEETDIEAVKGGLSNAMKRAAVQWGIGRYLYDLEEGWAVISENGANYQAASTKPGKEYPGFRWDPPKLPAWALPSDPTEKPKAEPKQTAVVDRAVGITTAADHLVKGKKLADYTGQELHDMQKALRADGKDKHKLLLADITTVLNDRLLGPSAKRQPAPAPPTDDQRVAGMKAGVASDDSTLPFAAG